MLIDFKLYYQVVVSKLPKGSAVKSICKAGLEHSFNLDGKNQEMAALSNLVEKIHGQEAWQAQRSMGLQTGQD